MTAIRRIVAAFVMTITLACAACALFRSPPVMHRYTIPDTAVAPSLPAGLNLEIGSVTGLAPFHDTGVAYQISPFRLDNYRFHRWVAPPTEILTQRLTGMIEQPAAGLASPAAKDDPIMLLDARIRAFQEVDEGGHSSGLVEIEFCLTPTTSMARPAWCQNFRRDTTASANTPEAAAAAISKSLNDILTDLMPALSSQAPALGGKP